MPVPQSSKTAGFQQCAAATTDGSVVFRIISQPETQHRARYQTEGSRGAIKDRTGTGYPTVQLDGCRKTTKIQIFIGNEAGKVMPHMFYQVCKVTGKNSNPCDENRVDGTDMIELRAKPHNDMKVICDCVGILKERFTDIEARFPQQKSWKNSAKKSTKCRMVFRTIVENRTGQQETLQVVSDVINCSQLPGTPEILKMSADSSPIEGGGELWMIGKNFLKDTRVIFSYSIVKKEEPLWVKVVEPRHDFFHQSHLITEIPPFFDASFCGDVEISIFIKCGEKLSDPVPFTYEAKPVQFTFAPATRDSSEFVIHKNEAALGCTAKQNNCPSGSVSVIKANHSVCKKARPTILEPLEIKRIRTISGPCLVNENAILVSDTSNKDHSRTSFPSMGFPFSGITKETVYHRNTERLRSMSNQEVKGSHSTHINTSEDEEQLFSFDDGARSSNQDSLLDENSFLSTRADATSCSKTDFSTGFNFNGTNEVTNNECDQEVQSINDRRVEPDDNSKDEQNENIPNVSYEATSDEKATISISLPTSILKDQKHFQTVMNTINNALIKQDVPEKEESKEIPMKAERHLATQVYNTYSGSSIYQRKDITEPDQSNQWQSPSPNNTFHHSEEAAKERQRSISATQCTSSMPVSVLFKTRKRAFTGDSADTAGNDSYFEDTHVSNAEPQWDPLVQIATDEETWKSEIDDMLDAAIADDKDTLPMEWKNKDDVSTKDSLEDKADNGEEQLNAMDWSTDTNAVSIQVNIGEDSSRNLPAYLIEPVTASEVREALDIIKTFQNNVEEKENIQIKSTDIFSENIGCQDEILEHPSFVNVESKQLQSENST